MASDQPPDPCPHLPLAGTAPDPDDPLGDAPDLDPGMTWQQFPYDSSFLIDPLWYDTAGRDLIIQKRIFMLPSEDDQVAETLRVVDAFPKRGLDVLVKAAIRGKPHVIRALLDHGVRTHPVVGDGDGDGDDDDDESLLPLHTAAFQGHLDCVKILAESGRVDLDFCDASSTPLQRAALAGHLDVVKYLLATGKVDVRREFVDEGETKHPLEWIVRSGNTQTAHFLIDALLSSEPADSAVSAVPDAAIYAAACEGNLDIMKRLLRIRGIPCGAEGDAHGGGPSLSEQAIHRALGGAAEQAQADMLQFLQGLVPQLSLGNFAQSDEGAEHFKRGLSQAVEDGNKDVFDFLASYFPGDGHRSPEAQLFLRSQLYDAVMNSSLPMVKHLVEVYEVDVNDGSPNPHNITPVAVASARSDESIVRYLLEEAPVRPDLALGAGPTNVRPLWYAVKEGSGPVIRLLLKHAAPRTLIPGEESDKTPYMLVVAACLDLERQVRVYTDKESWENAPREEVRAYVELDAEGEDVKALGLNIEAST